MHVEGCAGERSKEEAGVLAPQAGGDRARALEHFVGKWIGRSRVRGGVVRARAQPSPDSLQCERRDWSWPESVCRVGKRARGRCFS